MYIEKAKLQTQMQTPIQKLDCLFQNNIYIKRDDLYPFCFGGNKARKAVLFFDDIKRCGADFVVTYGSGSSNHCRVVANMAAKTGIKCCVISPLESNEFTYNRQMVDLFGANIITCPVSEVKSKIDRTLTELRSSGYNPYFIGGGGHGNLGTKAYYECFKEIELFEDENNLHFDYIFHASGTGTTQAGLVCGQLLSNVKRTIVGISIAREKERGKKVVVDSIKSFIEEIGIDKSDDEILENTRFIDKYICGGYGKTNNEINNCIKEMLINYGIPLDETYTGKAFYGMREFLNENAVSKKNVLFIHTGGTPLFFDFLKKQLVIR